MRNLNVSALLILGLALALGGAILSYLMVLRILAPSFWLVFLAYGTSVAGTITGFVGAAFIIRGNRRQ